MQVYKTYLNNDGIERPDDWHFCSEEATSICHTGPIRVGYLKEQGPRRDLYIVPDKNRGSERKYLDILACPVRLKIGIQVFSTFTGQNHIHLGLQESGLSFAIYNRDPDPTDKQGMEIQNKGEVIDLNEI